MIYSTKKKKGIDNAQFWKFTHFFLSPATCQALATTAVRTTDREQKSLTKEWWRGFKRRHRNLTLSSPRSLEQARAKQSSDEILADFQSKLTDTIKKNHITASHCWNVDEKGFVIDPIPRKVVAEKRTTAIQQHRRSNDHVTVNVCCSAAGQYLPPQIIYPRKQLRAVLIENGPPDALYCVSDKGGMNADLFVNWFEQIFLPGTNRECTQVRRKPHNGISIYYNQHSMYEAFPSWFIL